MRRLVVTVVTLALALTVVGAAPASSAGTARPRNGHALVLKPCPNVPGARCGTLHVPLDRTHHLPGTVGIRVERHPRLARDLPSLGTIVAVQGGPGYSTRASRYS
jgi:hypothetical protein